MGFRYPREKFYFFFESEDDHTRPAAAAMIKVPPNRVDQFRFSEKSIYPYTAPKKTSSMLMIPTFGDVMYESAALVEIWAHTASMPMAQIHHKPVTDAGMPLSEKNSGKKQTTAPVTEM